ncbi:uncharacterized protein LOC124942507 [Impatiens glandulifera]|uniref:uncharacterized protein LOC124942507 n=1 Tax=Impatiens glandulifera TaxID=253017 RepID=UPI001FB07A9B|nr:uncharacterized protein LOC124942507 [Impatiens glandulifera]
MESSTPEPQVPRPYSPTPEGIRAYKIFWRVLLVSNLAIGAYMFASASKKEKSGTDRKKASKNSSSKLERRRTVSTPDPLIPTVNPPPEKVQQPISEDQQQNLFKWILEEKRKVKPVDREAKKKIDEDKAVLKQFISTNSVPKL